MPKSRYKITLMPGRDTLEIVKAKQLDSGTRFIDATITGDDGEPLNLTGCKVRFSAEKPRGGGSIFNNCAILDGANGKIEIELTDQTLALHGTVEAEINIYGPDSETLILSTRSFEIDVQKMVRSEEAIESSNEFGALTVALADVNQYKDVVTSIDTRIGLSKDGVPVGETQPGDTIFDVLNKLFIWSKAQSTGAIAENVTYLRNLLGVANPAAGDALTVMGYLKYIADRGCIKSVQRGIVDASASTVITVASVNVNKAFINLPSILLINPAVCGTFTLTGPTSITVASNLNAAVSKAISWELIEYY